MSVRAGRASSDCSSCHTKPPSLIVFLCFAHFCFWYGRSFFDHPAPDRRATVNRAARAIARQATRVRALLAAAHFPERMGLQRRRHRPCARCVGARPWLGRGPKASALLSRSDRVAAGAGRDAAEAEPLSSLNRSSRRIAPYPNRCAAGKIAAVAVRTGSLSDGSLSSLLGFAASDFVELFLTLVFVVLALAWRPWIEPYGRRLAENTGWCMLLLDAASHRAPARASAAISNSHAKCFGRFQLSPDRRYATAFPSGESHASAASILRNVLRAAAARLRSRFFRSGQGLILAIGWTIFGHPWAGVALSVGALCALCYWMLRAWTTPGWALVGGLLAVIEFGPLSQWMNSYWGGAVSACAGCLVFGSLPRLRRERQRALCGAPWAWGLVLQWL